MHLKTDTSSNRHFARVPTISKSRNSFSVSEKHVTSIQFDSLYPLYWKMIYPGDTINLTFGCLARLSTQITTLYDDLYVDVHAWFNPLRLLQTDWARYQFNAQPLGPTQNNSALTSPKIDLSGLTTGFASKSLYDYFGYPTLINMSGLTNEHMHNYLGRSYNLTWNENYRDQNLQAAIPFDVDNGPDNPADYVIRKRGKRHDRFTSMLTAAQKGPSVQIPLGTTAPIVTTGTPFTMVGAGQVTQRNMLMGSTRDLLMSGANFTPPEVALTFGNHSGLQADLTQAVSATLNQLRQSYAIQHLLEADARGGTRDVESIQHRWGVTVPDYRLQRPEYLGGQTFSFDGHIIPQTSATETGGTPQANLAEFSQAISRFNIVKSFVEHGVLMILVSARSNITYQQGLSRELSYKTRFDWYQPEFANLGEVAVRNKELYFSTNDTQNNATLGFQEYAYELRYGLNRVSSEMRSNFPQSLDIKHMADDYSSLPTLSSGWIESNTPISRNTVVDASVSDPIELNTLVSGKITRTLPMYSVPGLYRL